MLGSVVIKLGWYQKAPCRHRAVRSGGCVHGAGAAALQVLEFVVSAHRVMFLLQADIMDINEIFKDLGMMIHEQGDVIGKSTSEHQRVFLFLFLHRAAV